MKIKSLLVLLLILNFACSKSTKSLFDSSEIVKGSDSPYIKSTFYKKKKFELAFNQQSENEIKARYLGCGGFYFESGNSSLMIDPFFSNTGPLELLVFGVKTKKRNVRHGLEGLSQLKEKNRAILVTHSHYDHLMDVPFVHFKNSDPTVNKIYGSTSTKNILSSLLADSSIIDLEESDVSTWYKQGRSYKIDTDSLIVITPVITTHAPHLGDIRLYNGEAKTMSNYDKEIKRTRAGKWRLGQTFSFLIDFVNEDGDVEFRIYIQSSAAQPKYGWINEALAEKPIDLAILGAASFEHTTEYPEALVNHLRPKKIMICHWEDFFVRYKRPKKRIVRFTNLRKFVKRLNSVYPYEIEGEEKFLMTDPGIDFTIKY